MQSETYICTKEDLPDIIQIINDTSSMYGTDLQALGIAAANIARVRYIVNSGFAKIDGTEFFIIGYKENGILLGFCINGFWSSLPAWNCGPYFTKLDIFDKVAAEILLLSIIKKGIELAEMRSIFNFYFVTRFSKKWKRASNMIREQFPDYTTSEVEVLEPFTKSKYNAFAMLLGGMNGNNEKPISIIQCTKSVLYGDAEYKRNNGLHI
jgi:hypothetical protein